QKDPDPDFAIIKCPNPEEGESALELSLKLAEKENAWIVLATDLDADQLAEDGRWKVFTGKELAALFGGWIFGCWGENKSRNADVKGVYMLATTVSSKILNPIVLKEGYHFEETLSKSIGFLCGTSILDKGGMSTAVVVAEMVSYLETMNITLKQQLIKVYEKYVYLKGFAILILQKNIQNFTSRTETKIQFYAEMCTKNGLIWYPI
ncbi:hypothetical protein HPG69_014858, partial [Diceros bicornis minor]